MPTLFPTDALDGLIRTGGSARVNVNVEPGFAPGDEVMAININPRTHTRLPTYVRGKRGIVMRDHGAFVFPDTNAQLKGEKPQHVYSVMFEAGELWGDAEFPGDKVLIDMFEDYLRPANGK
jgi:Nitrile hydratase beta subunit